MKMSKSAWKIVIFAALLALMAGLCATASAESCAPGTHKWYYDTNPIPSDSYPCGATFTITDHCTICGETWVRTITLSEHRAGNAQVEYRPAGCPDCLRGAQKITTIFCTRCRQELSHSIEELAPLGHDWGEWKVEKEATCEAAGYEARYCKRCNLREERPLTALGHDWGPYELTTAPTCQDKGQETSTCKRDSSHKQYRDVDPTGHDWDAGVITKEPDCTNPGVKTFTCKNNPAHTKTEPVPVNPNAHDWDDGKITKQPNCTTPGVKTYTCNLNPAHTYTESIPIVPDAHDYDNGKVTVPPECEKPGLKVYTCQNNPEHTKEETLPPTGHKWDGGTVIKEPTATDSGIRQYVCENNSAHTRDEVIPKIIFGNNTLCAFGPRLRDVDLYPYNTEVWYMFTPFDASKEGRQTFELVASNNYIVGTLTMTIRDGKITVDYTLNSNTIDVTLEFFTILPQISEIHVYEPEKLLSKNMKVRQAIDLQENFGDDRNLVLYFCSRIDYTYSPRFQPLNYDSIAHQRLLNEMLKMMDR